MAFVVCPSCYEKGRVPKQLIGRRIKCQKCGTSFVVEAPKSAPVAATGHETMEVLVFDRIPNRNEIAVDGLDDAEWQATAVLPASEEHDAAPPEESSPAFAAHDEPVGRAGAQARHYKILTPRDPWFEGRFDAARLEECLNQHARAGWTVNSMTSAQLPGFNGTVTAELVVLLER